MKRIHPICALTVLLMGLRAAAGAAGFAEKPKVGGTGEAITIRFAASEATDVEVAVLDAGGRIVRHLAAGLLGGNAPEPLQKDSLKQQLTWDGKDDLGRPAKGGPGSPNATNRVWEPPFKVRVGLGVTPRFDKMIADNPAALGSVRGFAVGANGELFVLHNHGSIHPDDNSGFCAVFGRDGRYLRTILPYSGDLPANHLPGVRQIVVLDGDGLRRAQSSRGVPTGGPLWTVLASRSRCGGSLAVAPDDQTFYATDLSEGTGPKLTRYHRVFKFTLDDKAPKPFVGLPDESGAGRDRLNDPNSVAVDDRGGTFAEGQPLGKSAGPDYAGQMLMLTMDRVHNKLYFDESVYDPATGRIEQGLGKVVRKRDSISGVGTKGGNGAVGLDGMMYLMGYSAWMKRFDADMKLVPFADGTDGVFINGGSADAGGPDAPGSLRLLP